jgi:hypothetical protein
MESKSGISLSHLLRKATNRVWSLASGVRRRRVPSPWFCMGMSSAPQSPRQGRQVQAEQSTARLFLFLSTRPESRCRRFTQSSANRIGVDVVDLSPNRFRFDQFAIVAAGSRCLHPPIRRHPSLEPDKTSTVGRLDLGLVMVQTVRAWQRNLDNPTVVTFQQFCFSADLNEPRQSVARAGSKFR